MAKYDYTDNNTWPTGHARQSANAKPVEFATFSITLIWPCPSTDKHTNSQLNVSLGWIILCVIDTYCYQRYISICNVWRRLGCRKARKEIITAARCATCRRPCPVRRRHTSWPAAESPSHHVAQPSLQRHQNLANKVPACATNVACHKNKGLRTVKVSMNSGLPAPCQTTVDRQLRSLGLFLWHARFCRTRRYPLTNNTDCSVFTRRIKTTAFLRLTYSCRNCVLAVRHFNVSDELFYALYVA